MGPGGTLYGFTNAGGAQKEGSIFALKPPASPGGSWTFVPLYSMAPPGPALVGWQDVLAVSADGLLYGTSYGGGNVSVGFGTVFALRP
jgi:uncharacterized repeat protein (TIGR03803 family)